MEDPSLRWMEKGRGGQYRLDRCNFHVENGSACCNCSFDSVAKTGRNEGGYSTNRIDKNRETHPIPQPRFISPFYFGTRSVNKLSLAITRNGEAHFSSHFRFGNARNARDITLPRIPWNAYVYLYP